VPRRVAYKAAHPETEIIYIRPYWQAIIHEDTAQTIVIRHSLKALLDKLEALDAEK